MPGDPNLQHEWFQDYHPHDTVGDGEAMLDDNDQEDDDPEVWEDDEIEQDYE